MLYQKYKNSSVFTLINRYPATYNARSIVRRKTGARKEPNKTGAINGEQNEISSTQTWHCSSVRRVDDVSAVSRAEHRIPASIPERIDRRVISAHGRRCPRTLSWLRNEPRHLLKAEHVTVIATTPLARE